MSRLGEYADLDPRPDSPLMIASLWLQLLDHASERGISDHEYMALADRFSMQMSSLDHALADAMGHKPGKFRPFVVPAPGQGRKPASERPQDA